MYEKYTRQALPERKYRELLGSALCVFNSNNSFIIENILRINNTNYNWYKLIDKESGRLKKDVIKTIAKYDISIANLFDEIVNKRNRIIHSFQITKNGKQILRTKERETNLQYDITEQYLIDFIKDNQILSDKLYEVREKLKEGVIIE